MTSIYTAIMKAADKIESEPFRFNFGSTDFPDCGAPGCALGWIGHFLGYTETKYDSYPNGVLTVTKDLGVPAESHYDFNNLFYSRMEQLVRGWRAEANKCAQALRLYAAKYHAPAKPVQQPPDWNALSQLSPNDGCCGCRSERERL
jgi:hypothetical protein